MATRKKEKRKKKKKVNCNEQHFKMNKNITNNKKSIPSNT